MPDPISWAFSWPYFLAAFLGGYFLGSIPFGLILTRVAGLGDVRRIGSGNIGATNVLRTGHKGLALATLLLDTLKGTAPVIIANFWGPDMGLIAGFAAIMGHLFPLWLGFKGGKGVATTLGVFLGLSPLLGVSALLTWILVAVVTRYSSLASLLSIASAPLFAWFLLKDLQVVQWCVIIALFVWARHWQNITRLLRGQETKIGKTAAPPPDNPPDPKDRSS